MWPPSCLLFGSILSSLSRECRGLRFSKVSSLIRAFWFVGVCALQWIDIPFKVFPSPVPQDRLKVLSMQTGPLCYGTLVWNVLGVNVLDHI